MSGPRKSWLKQAWTKEERLLALALVEKVGRLETSRWLGIPVETVNRWLQGGLTNQERMAQTQELKAREVVVPTRRAGGHTFTREERLSILEAANGMSLSEARKRLGINSRTLDQWRKGGLSGEERLHDYREKCRQKREQEARMRTEARERARQKMMTRAVESGQPYTTYKRKDGTHVVERKYSALEKATILVETAGLSESEASRVAGVPHSTIATWRRNLVPGLDLNATNNEMVREIVKLLVPEIVSLCHDYFRRMCENISDEDIKAQASRDLLKLWTSGGIALTKAREAEGLASQTVQHDVTVGIDARIEQLTARFDSPLDRLADRLDIGRVSNSEGNGKAAVEGDPASNGLREPMDT